MNVRDQIALSHRLGMPTLARYIEKTNGPWIVPTAKAVFALRAAGYLDPVEHNVFEDDAGELRHGKPTSPG